MGKKKDKQKYVNSIRPENLPTGSLELIRAQLAKPAKQRSTSATDEVILKNGNARVSSRVTADLIGLPVEAVQKRYMELLRQEYDMPHADRLLILTAQTEHIMNSLQNMMDLGSTEHHRDMLKAIDQMAKLHGMYASEGVKDAELMTEAQFQFLLLLLNHIGQSIGASVKAALGKELEPEIIDAAVTDGLDQVGVLLNGHLDKRVQLT